MKAGVKCQAGKCRTQPVVSAEAQGASLVWAAGGTKDQSREGQQVAFEQPPNK